MIEIKILFVWTNTRQSGGDKSSVTSTWYFCSCGCWIKFRTISIFRSKKLLHNDTHGFM